MAKSSVYSWRLSPETKIALEQEARREGMTMATLLDRLAREWLERRRDSDGPQAAEQGRLHAQAAKTFGTIAGGNPGRSESARVTLRRRLAERHGRRRNH